MSGQNESEIEQLERYERETDDFLKKKGHIKLQYTSACETYLNMTSAEFARMTQQELCEVAREIYCYTTYLQDQTNHYNRRIHICQYEITKLLIHVVQDDRWMNAIMDHPIAMRWHAIEMEAQFRLDSQNYIGISLNRVADMANEMQKNKRSEQYAKKNQY